MHSPPWKSIYTRVFDARSVPHGAGCQVREQHHSFIAVLSQKIRRGKVKVGYDCLIQNFILFFEINLVQFVSNHESPTLTLGNICGVCVHMEALVGRIRDGGDQRGGV
jgi:hypothetical protein